ncbi:MAG: hypothetical protein GY826_23680 [Fuerstiella sp.]|nr:hypothetical protein [Fuerstiella sp.]
MVTAPKAGRRGLHRHGAGERHLPDPRHAPHFLATVYISDLLLTLIE